MITTEKVARLELLFTDFSISLISVLKDAEHSFKHLSREGMIFLQVVHGVALVKRIKLALFMTMAKENEASGRSQSGKGGKVVCWVFPTKWVLQE